MGRHNPLQGSGPPLQVTKEPGSSALLHSDPPQGKVQVLERKGSCAASAELDLNS